MKTTLTELIASLVFLQELQKTPVAALIIKGGRRNKRELVIRNIIFNILETQNPSEYRKEMGHRDLVSFNSGAITELGNNMSFQPIEYSIDKFKRDYAKRLSQGIPSTYTACHIITDIESLDLTHGIARSYINPILKLNRTEAERRIESVWKYALSVDMDARHIQITIEFEGTKLHLHFIIVDFQ